MDLSKPKDEEEGSDGEFERWERAQIAKGVTAYQMEYLKRNERRLQTRKDKGRRQQSSDDENAMDIAAIEETTNELPRQTKRQVAPVPDQLQPVLSLDETLVNMRVCADEHSQQIRQRELDSEKLQNHLDDIDEQLKQLSEALPTLQTRFNLYQEMVAYVRDYIECYCEKMPAIEALEARLVQLHTAHTDFLERRRRADVRDQYERCQMLVAQHTKGTPFVPPDPDRQMRTADRDARRMRRRQARERQGLQAVHNDGLSSDDEVPPSREAQFKAEEAQIKVDAQQMLTDVNEEYTQTQQVLQRFYRWLTVDRQSYEDAYIGLCLSKLVAPIVRLQLLAFAPLDEKNSLTQHQWLRDACCMGIDERGKAIFDDTELATHDDVVNVVPGIVDKCIVPRLTEIITRIFDPLSSGHCRALAAQLLELRTLGSNVLEPKSKSMQRLYSALVQRVRTTLDDDLFMPLFAKEYVFNHLRFSAMSAFVAVPLIRLKQAHAHYSSDSSGRR